MARRAGLLRPRPAGWTIRPGNWSTGGRLVVLCYSTLSAGVLPELGVSLLAVRKVAGWAAPAVTGAALPKRGQAS